MFSPVLLTGVGQLRLRGIACGENRVPPTTTMTRCANGSFEPSARFAARATCRCWTKTSLRPCDPRSAIAQSVGPNTLMRSLADVLKQESPLALVREAVWRTRKKLEKGRILAQIEEEPCPVTFRHIPYYQPASSEFSPTSRALITGFADQICEGRFPFLGYGTVHLGRRPQWNVDFVSGLDWPDVPMENRYAMRFDGSDLKAPYELSRLQFLPILGKAYVLTRDER